eukprot:TRINITY_DN7682_c0_g2_i2.p1 TRINITY_DN7682_c0_g2~~TRINITY_DN7682_c0_g2_i2.p1  ORF type:complete len:305 (+),score=84.86 TRINITY_DN7682_c0_g2_i2:29-943(+)
MRSGCFIDLISQRSPACLTQRLVRFVLDEDRVAVFGSSTTTCQSTIDYRLGFLQRSFLSTQQQPSQGQSTARETRGQQLAKALLLLREDYKNMTETSSNLKTAATLLLCLHSPPDSTTSNGSDYKILMVKRSTKARFMPGAHVFPGGILEDTDSDSSWVSSVGNSPSLEITTKVAAIRELFEETNVLLFERSPQAVDAVAPKDLSFRERVRANASSFPSVLKELGDKRLPINSLLPWSHWVTPKQERYRYDTYFYLSPLYLATPSSLLAAQDNSETTQVSWLRPEEALQLFRKGTHGVSHHHYY